MKRIHIVGVSPRSGTTLLAEAMKHCFKIDYATDHEDDLNTRTPGHPEVFLSKCPKDIMKIGPSLKVDPHLYALCMIRDPRDILVSRHRKDPDRIQNQIANRIPFLKKVALFSRYHEVADVSDSSKEALGGIRPIKPTSIGKWKKHKKRVAGQLEKHGSISNDLIRFGYEKTTNGLKSWRILTRI